MKGGNSMYLLTNQQRACFALSAVPSGWELMELSPSENDQHRTYAYITADNRAVKMIVEGDDRYFECDVNERLSPDRACILPKTAKGKPVRLTAANMEKKTHIGMALSYSAGSVCLYSNISNCTFYNSSYAGVAINTISDFFGWIDKWCAQTGDQELADIQAFANAPRRHVKYKEGDFFRFRLDRHHFGYGRIIINYDDFRKKNIPFWDVFFGKPILAGIYHMVTTEKTVPPEQLDTMQMLPPQMIMDNTFFYGESEIIGNLPVDERNIDFPVHYGASICLGDKSVMYQCGRTFRVRDDIQPLFSGFINNGIGWSFDVRLPLLKECIDEKSNAPYWKQSQFCRIRQDLRNPQNEQELKQIRAQFDLL